MKKTITIIKQQEKNVSDIFNGTVETDLLFRELQRDTIGRSGSSPTWGYVYSNENSELTYLGIALHKEFDYDYPKAAYGEKVWSIMGKALLTEETRVPDIDIVLDSSGNEEIISYRLMDNDREDMIHIKDTLFNKFERDEIKSKKDILTIDDILECVKLQIDDPENYEQIKKAMIHVLMLDAVTNNGDRHAFNWALVRNKESNHYQLAVFDHSSAFINMFEDRSYVLGKGGWSSTFITVDGDKGRNDIGSSGEKIVEYIARTYPEYFEEFCDQFNQKLPNILLEIQQEKMRIDFNRLGMKLGEKNRFLKRLRNRGEIGDE